MAHLIQESGHFQTVMVGNGYYSVEFNTYNNNNYMFLLNEVEFKTFFPAGTPDAADEYYIEINSNEKLQRVEQDTAEEFIIADEMPEIAEWVSEYKGDSQIMELKAASERVNNQLAKFDESDQELISSIEEARQSSMNTAETMVNETVSNMVTEDVPVVETAPEPVAIPKSYAGSFNLDDWDQEDDEGDI